MTMAFGLNFGTDSSKASQGVFGDGQFQDYYKNLNSMFGPMMSGAGDMSGSAKGLAPFFQMLMQKGAGGAESLLQGGAAGGSTDQILQQLMDSFKQSQGPSNMGKMYESIVGGQGNTYVDPMVDAMKRSSMENLDMMTGRSGLDAAAAGQGGGSRHAMTNAILSRTANSDMLDREMGMRGGAYDKDLAMKMGIAQQADTNLGGTQDRMMSLLGSTDANKMAGIGAMSGLGDFGVQSMSPQMMAMMAPYYAMMMQGGAMGDPTVLSKSSGKSMSGGFGL
jgi:hypothetical protein